MPVLQLELPDLEATCKLGALLAEGLVAGDVISLSGALGSGKSALARAIIQAANPDETDVPSPTFTLVQTYALGDGTPLWHLDLYRLETPHEAMALGLDDAFVDAVCLIEWPDRLKNSCRKQICRFISITLTRTARRRLMTLVTAVALLILLRRHIGQSGCSQLSQRRFNRDIVQRALAFHDCCFYTGAMAPRNVYSIDAGLPFARDLAVGVKNWQLHQNDWRGADPVAITPRRAGTSRGVS